MREIKLNSSDIRFGRWLVILNGAIPGALLIVDALRGQLGANPANFAIRSTGFLALVMLIASLAVTPLMRLSGQQWLGNFRRALGLYAFFYSLAHFGLYIWLDRALDLGSAVRETFVRTYLLWGVLALIAMTPLAVTSTNAAIRRLGPTWWKRLHRLAYLAALAGVLHYALQQKADLFWPGVYAAVLAGLLGYRAVRAMLDRWIAQTVLRDRRRRFWKGRLKVVETIHETQDVRTFRLASIDGAAELPFDYRAGQYLNLSLDIDGRRVNRSYTISSSPGRAGTCDITVKREANGTASRYLHDVVQVGQAIDVSAPAGRFTFEPRKDETGIVMIAGGVGVTPLMSKLRWLIERNWPGEVYFVFSARTESDIIFREELESIARSNPNVRLTVTLTRPGDAWHGERGRLDARLLDSAVPEIASRPVHICGPQEMADAIRVVLIGMGVPPERISSEAFTSPKSPGKTSATPVDDGAARQLRFARSQKVVSLPLGKTILEAAEEVGVDLNFDCRSGICGQCKIRKLSGAVVMDASDALTPADEANDLILACQARCVEDVEVEA